MRALSTMLLLAGILSCSSQEEPILNTSNLGNPNRINTDWRLPKDEIIDGGPGKDGIPALEDPKLVSSSNAEASYLFENELVMGIISEDQVHAYPHNVLDWHEIINTTVGDLFVSITYCPLTGTGTAWDRKIEDEVTTFGVSGLLYNSNLIPYDRLSNSNWSQMLLQGVQGKLADKRVKTYNVIETTWKTWKNMYPNTVVVSEVVGLGRNYNLYPYRDYKTSDFILFPVNNEDDRLHPKERVLGITYDTQGTVYRFESVQGGGLIHDQFEGKDIMVIGNDTENYLVSYYKEDVDGNPIDVEFEYVANELPVILKDNLGNYWDIFGKVVEGPNLGLTLKPTGGFIGYWFSWAAFFPDIKIYE